MRVAEGHGCDTPTTSEGEMWEQLDRDEKVEIEYR